MRAHQASRAAHERLVALLPIAVIVTDDAGVIRTANAAAASLLGLRVDRVVRKPIFAFVDQRDRGRLRQQLSDAVAERSGFRCTVALTPRHLGGPLRTDIAATVAPERPSETREISWVLTPTTADGAPADGEEGPHEGTDNGTHPLLARSLAELATLTVRSTDRAATLTQVAYICQRAFPVRTFVSITLGPPAEPDVLATDSQIAQRLDGLQVTAGEGPCQSAWATGEVVVCHRMDNDDRWPRLRRMMVDDPPVAVLAIPVLSGQESIGALNVYAHDPELASERWVRHGELLAATVTAVLHEVEAKADLEALARQLRVALDSRAPIEQAKGVLMATRGCTAEEAFTLLREMSNRENVRVRDLAEQIVERAGASSSGKPPTG